MAENLSTDRNSDLQDSDDPFILGKGKHYAFAGPKAGVALNITVVFAIILLVLATALLQPSSQTRLIESIAGLLPIFVFGVVLAGLSALAEFLEEFVSETHRKRPSRPSPLAADIADVLAFGLTIASVGFFAWGVWRLGWILIPGGAALHLACAAC